MSSAYSSKGIDPEAWALTGALKRRQAYARLGLRSLADRGWSTALNADLSHEQFAELSTQARHGIRQLWKEALRRDLRSRPLPAPSHSEPCPAGVDPDTWAFTTTLTNVARVRRALLKIAEQGLATHLEVTPSTHELARLGGAQRRALWELWSEASTQRRRTSPVPTALIGADRRPETVDQAAWTLACTLRGPAAPAALAGLRALSRRAQPTTLQAIVPMSVFVQLGGDQRTALRQLWTTAAAQGVRTAPVPPEDSEWIYKRDLDGIDRAAVAFVRELGDPQQRYQFIWLRRLRDAGLDTSLDCDLDVANVRDLYATLLDETVKRRHGITGAQHTNFRVGVRRMYQAALARGTRTRAIPQLIVKELVYRRGSSADLVARLPLADQNAIATVRTNLRELNRRQQAGRTGVKPPRFGERKATEAQTTSKMKISALHAFLQHASKWELEDQARGITSSVWSIERGLSSLLTPANVARWVYKGHNPDRSPKAKKTCVLHHGQMLRLLERAAEAEVPWVAPDVLAAISAELERVRDTEEWNVPSVLENRPDDDDETGKWFPTLDQLRTGLAALREDWKRTQLAHDNGDTFLRYWRATRDFVMTYATFLCMWRVDTTTTIDLSRVVRDPTTGRVRWQDGALRIRYGARAKQAHGHGYLVETLLIPGEVVDLLEVLLELEGRTLENPLRAGEEPLLLNIGDRYGRDELLETTRTVIPLFRSTFDAPAGLTNEAVAERLRDRLFTMGWDATNPHTLRAAGAIEWRFVRGRTYAAIMRLGNWHDENTLKRCYARLSGLDIDAEITNGAPSADASRPPSAHAIGLALDEAQRRATALRLTPNAPTHEIAATARVFRVAATQLERTAGLADASAVPNLFRSDEDVVRLDAVIRPFVKGGVNEIVGYEVLRPKGQVRPRPARSERRMLKRLRAETRTARPPRPHRRTA